MGERESMCACGGEEESVVVYTPATVTLKRDFYHRSAFCTGYTVSYFLALIFLLVRRFLSCGCVGFFLFAHCEILLDCSF